MHSWHTLSSRGSCFELHVGFRAHLYSVSISFSASLYFSVNPPSSVFDYEEMELVEGGADMDVTMDNVELYVQKCADFYLNTGIINQVGCTILSCSEQFLFP